MKAMPAIAWPEGKQSALCLTVDIDAETMWTSVDADNHRRPFIMGQSDYEIDVGIPLILDLLERRHISTTFFVPGSVAQAHSETVSDIARAGHEIACHGWLHESTDGFSRTDETALIKRSTDAITDIVGSRPVGYRAGLADVNPQTWEILHELGYLYSSNVPASLWPYRHNVPGADLVEIPLHAMMDDGPYFLIQRRPPNYRQFIPPSAVAEIWREEFKGIHTLGGVTVLILHPQLIGRPSRLRVLEELIDLAESLGNVWIPTMREVGELCVATLPHNDKRYRDTPDR